MSLERTRICMLSEMSWEGRSEEVGRYESWKFHVRPCAAAPRVDTTQNKSIAQHMQDDCTTFCQLWAAIWLDARPPEVSEAGV